MNPVVHFEMPYEDPARMSRFYQQAFGWQTQALGEEMGNYILATTSTASALASGPVGGSINGGFFPKQPDLPGQHPSVVIAVDDVSASMQAVRQAGGTVLGEPMEIPGVGRYVAFIDTEGNRASMLQAMSAPA